MAEAAKAESTKKVGDALMHVLKEVHALPEKVPGVGSMDEIMATHNDSRVNIIDADVVEDSAEPSPDSGGVANPGDIVTDEDNNASLVNDEMELQPLPTRKEVDI